MDSLIDNYRWTYRSSASYGMASFTEQLAGEEQKLALLSLAPLMHEASSQPENGVDRTRGVISGILKVSKAPLITLSDPLDDHCDSTQHL